jgi:hypothetical protein
MKRERKRRHFVIFFIFFLCHHCLHIFINLYLASPFSTSDI